MLRYSSATTSSPYAWPSDVMVTSSCGCDRTTTESAEPAETQMETRAEQSCYMYQSTFKNETPEAVIKVMDHKKTSCRVPAVFHLIVCFGFEANAQKQAYYTYISN